MSDSTNDCARDAAVELYGLTEKGMVTWLKFSGKSDMPDWFLDNVLGMNDRRVLDALNEKFWDEYVESAHYAASAKV